MIYGFPLDAARDGCDEPFGGGMSAPMSADMPMPTPVRPMAPYNSLAVVSDGWRPSM